MKKTGNIIRDMHNRLEEAWEVLQASGREFDPAVTHDQISVGAVEDLLALEVGESTFVECDVTRIK